MCGRYSINHKMASPGESLPVFLKNKTGLMRWGYQTSFASIINARMETIFTKLLYRDSINNYRCLVPMDGFYEWQTGTKIPYYITSRIEGGLLAAGIYEPSGTFCIITKDSVEDMMHIHNRMPCLLNNNIARSWLDNPQVLVSENCMKKLSFVRM